MNDVLVFFEKMFTPNSLIKKVILYELIYFHDDKNNYIFDNLCVIIKLITLFICYEYKAVIKQLLITSHHFLIITFSKKQIVIEH